MTRASLGMEVCQTKMSWVTNAKVWTRIGKASTFNVIVRTMTTSVGHSQIKASSISMPVTWLLAQGSPTVRFTGSVHTVTLSVPAHRVVTTATAQQVQL